jgi:hypothetical protein
MRDPFLCPDCQKLGYCRKYNTKKLERTFDVSEQAFFEMVNKPAKKVDQENPVIPAKLISLERIRAQFSKQTDMKPPSIIEKYLRKTTETILHNEYA